MQCDRGLKGSIQLDSVSATAVNPLTDMSQGGLASFSSKLQRSQSSPAGIMVEFSVAGGFSGRRSGSREQTETERLHLKTSRPPQTVPSASD